MVSLNDMDNISAAQQQDIDTSLEWGAENWKNLSAWAKREGRSYLSIMEKKKIDHMATMVERGETIKARLAEDCQRIKRLAEDNGFSENMAY